MSTPCENCGSHIRVCADCDFYKGKYIEIPDNATNGDVIMAMFPNAEYKHIKTMSGIDGVEVNGINGLYDNFGQWCTRSIFFHDDWWNAQYQKESEKWMKLIIDIDSETYKGLVTKSHIFVKHIFDAVRNGILIPDNATFGDVIEKITNRKLLEDNKDANYIIISNKLWHAPYQKGGTNRKNCEYRHENGNCLKVGGFCTSVDDEHCVKGGKE